MKKFKLFLGILVIVAFLAASHFILFVSLRPPFVNLDFRGLISSSVVLFTLITLLAWFAYGYVGLWLFAFVSSVTVFIFLNNTNNQYLIYQVVVFYIIGFFVWSCKNRMISRGISLQMRIDELEQERNASKAEYAAMRGVNEVIKEKIKIYALLRDLTKRLSSTLKLDAVVNIAIESISDFIKRYDVSLLFMVEEEAQELALKAVSSKLTQEPIKSKKGDIFDAWTLKQRQPLLVSDTVRDFRFNLDLIPAEYKRDYKSVAAVPLIFGNKVKGVLRVDSKEADAYNLDDLRLLAILADLFAIALENATLFHRVEELAIRDGLTGSYCHRYFKDRLDEDILKAKRIKQPLSLLMLDVDDFKDYNDRYGHIAGDIVLKNVAEILKSSVEPGDLVARYGGEEFALILFGRDKGEAKKSAEALRRKIESETFLLRKTETHISVSVGCASFPEDSIIRDELIRVADGALYRAKTEGKNRVCSA